MHLFQEIVWQVVFCLGLAHGAGLLVPTAVHLSERLLCSSGLTFFWHRWGSLSIPVGVAHRGGQHSSGLPCVAGAEGQEQLGRDSSCSWGRAGPAGELVYLPVTRFGERNLGFLFPRPLAKERSEKCFSSMPLGGSELQSSPAP